MAEEDFYDMDIDDGRIVAMDEQRTDDWQYSLRPRKLSEYIGQDKAKKNLEIFIQAAMNRGDSLDHVLLYGPPGLGKTTLAGIIANEMGVNFRQTSGPGSCHSRGAQHLCRDAQLLRVRPWPRGLFRGVKKAHDMYCRLDRERNTAGGLARPFSAGKIKYRWRDMIWTNY